MPAPGGAAALRPRCRPAPDCAFQSLEPAASAERPAWSAAAPTPRATVSHASQRGGRAGGRRPAQVDRVVEPAAPDGVVERAEPPARPYESDRRPFVAAMSRTSTLRSAMSRERAASSRRDRNAVRDPQARAVEVSGQCRERRRRIVEPRWLADDPAQEVGVVCSARQSRGGRSSRRVFGSRAGSQSPGRLIDLATARHARGNGFQFGAALGGECTHGDRATGMTSASGQSPSSSQTAQIGARRQPRTRGDRHHASLRSKARTARRQGRCRWSASRSTTTPRPGAGDRRVTFEIVTGQGHVVNERDASTWAAPAGGSNVTLTRGRSPRSIDEALGEVADGQRRPLVVHPVDAQDTIAQRGLGPTGGDPEHRRPSGSARPRNRDRTPRVDSAAQARQLGTATDERDRRRGGPAGGRRPSSAWSVIDDRAVIVVDDEVVMADTIEPATLPWTSTASSDCSRSRRARRSPCPISSVRVGSADPDRPRIPVDQLITLAHHDRPTDVSIDLMPTLPAPVLYARQAPPCGRRTPDPSSRGHRWPPRSKPVGPPDPAGSVDSSLLERIGLEPIEDRLGEGLRGVRGCLTHLLGERSNSLGEKPVTIAATVADNGSMAPLRHALDHPTAQCKPYRG